MKTTDKDYIEQKHSELFKKLDCFFAFSDKQFNEGLENAGGIEKTGKYVNMNGGLFCPEKNIEALINGMDDIKKNWEKDRKQVEQVRLIFKGVDNWNRPVWRAPDIKAYYGSTTELFSFGVTEEEVLKKVTTYDLCYFGDHFDCEPMGSSVPDKYYI